MRKLLALGMLLALTAAPVLAARPDNEKETDRLENSGMVMEEIMNIPDDIPQDLLDKAECVVVFPSVLKAAFIVGGSYGRGAMVCRSGEHFTGPWGAPSMMALEGASLGFQLGGQATDFVLLIMNPRPRRRSSAKVPCQYRRPDESSFPCLKRSRPRIIPTRNR